MKEGRRFPKMIVRGAVAAVVLAGCGSEDAPKAGEWRTPGVSAAPTTLRPEPSLSPSLSLSPTPSENPTPQSSFTEPTPNTTSFKTIPQAIRDYYNINGPYDSYFMGDMTFSTKKNDAGTITACVDYTYLSRFKPEDTKGNDNRPFTIKANNGEFVATKMGGSCDLGNNTTNDIVTLKAFSNPLKETIKTEIKNAYEKDWDGEYTIAEFTNLQITPNVKGYGAACADIIYQKTGSDYQSDTTWGFSFKQEGTAIKVYSLGENICSNN